MMLVLQKGLPGNWDLYNARKGGKKVLGNDRERNGADSPRKARRLGEGEKGGLIELSVPGSVSLQKKRNNVRLAHRLVHGNGRGAGVGGGGGDTHLRKKEEGKVCTTEKVLGEGKKISKGDVYPLGKK